VDFYPNYLSGTYHKTGTVLDLAIDHLKMSEKEGHILRNAYRHTHMRNNPNSHIRNGWAEQWKYLWPESLNSLYNDLYKDIEVELGYA
jgi:hypothetical protein